MFHFGAFLNVSLVCVTLQALFHVAPFVRLMSEHQECSVVSCSRCRVKNLIAEMSSTNVSIFKPILLLSRLKGNANVCYFCEIFIRVISI